MARRARTTEAKQQKRRQILNAAKELFSENGYQNTSIEMITERAGESTGTFYLYFKNKREIYVTLYGDGVDLFHQMAEQAISAADGSVLSRLSAIAHAYLRFYTEHTGYFEILAFLKLHDIELKDHNDMSSILDEKAIKLLKMIEGVIKQGIDNGELAPMDTWTATNALWGMMDGLVMLAERRNIMVMRVSLEELFTQALEILFYGMVKR